MIRRFHFPVLPLLMLAADDGAAASTGTSAAEITAPPPAPTEEPKLTIPQSVAAALKLKHKLVTDLATVTKERDDLTANLAQFRKDLDAATAEKTRLADDLSKVIAERDKLQGEVTTVAEHIAQLGFEQEKLPKQTAGEGPDTPASLFATWKGLKGAEKTAFFRQHEKQLSAYQPPSA